MLSNSARIFKKERKKKYNVCGRPTQWQKETRGGGHERYFLLKYIRWKVVLSDTKKRGKFVSMNTTNQKIKWRDHITNCHETGLQPDEKRKGGWCWLLYDDWNHEMASTD